MIRIACRVLLLFFFFVTRVEAQTWIIEGTIWFPDATLAPGKILVRDGIVADIGGDIQKPADTQPIPVTGIVVPGFVDLHNHLTWNVFPRWRPTDKFNNRYEWLDLPEYERSMRTPQANIFNKGLGCHANLFAEVKALIGGATSVVGSDYRTPDCASGLIRNLDLQPDFPAYPSGPTCEGDSTRFPINAKSVVVNEVYPLEIPDDRLAFYKCELRNGRLRSLVIHLSEGRQTDSSARREFRMLKERRALTSGMVIVHGSALTSANFTDMRAAGVGLVWSPRSNEELYGSTTNIAAAVQANVQIALAPDWSPTGSAGMIQELKFASSKYQYFNASRLIQMVTEVPARLARVDDRIGAFEKGKLADIVIFKARAGAPTPYESIVSSSPEDVQLVLVGGKPVYGDFELMQKLLPTSELTTLTVCGAAKALNLASSNIKWVEAIDKLKGELGYAPTEPECG